MTRKFLSFYKKNCFDFSDTIKWSRIDQTSHHMTLNFFVPETDLCVTNAVIKVLNNKEEPDKLWIEGIANANVVDRMQERLDPIGLDITNFLKNRQLLAHHSYYHPIGQVESIDVTDDGVLFKAWIGNPKAAKLTAMQEEIISLVKQGILKTVSVGFIPKQVRPAEYDEQGNLSTPTIVEKWELLELSIVAIPANQGSVFDIKKTINSEVQMSSQKIINKQTTEDTEPNNTIQEVLSLVKNIDSATKQNFEMLKTILDKIMQDSSPAEAVEEAACSDSDKEDEDKKKIQNIETTLEKVVASIKLIVNRLDEISL